MVRQEKVRLMTIAVDTENNDNITILSNNIEGNACNHEAEIAFLKNVISHLEKEKEEHQKGTHSYDPYF